MKLYRLKHKPTGLYYTPGSYHQSRCNLSRVGKVYVNRPKLPTSASLVKGQMKVSTRMSDWELIECLLIEIDDT